MPAWVKGRLKAMLAVKSMPLFYVNVILDKLSIETLVTLIEFFVRGEHDRCRPS